MKDDDCSHSDNDDTRNKIEKYLKQPEELNFETDSDFLTDKVSMLELALSFKRDSYLAYLPRDMKNDEDFMLEVLSHRPNAYNYAGSKLTKNAEFAVKSIQANPKSIDAVFFKHENFFNTIPVINEALKHIESDLFCIVDEISEHIHRKNVCSRDDLLKMFGNSPRDSFLVKVYASQVEAHLGDAVFAEMVTKNHNFAEFLEEELAAPSARMKR